MNIISQIRFLKIAQNVQKWLINLSEELGTKTLNLILDQACNKF